ncbi:MAG: hypothetical protein NVV83_15445 [Afipia sp.]|nr:hypothetical protein [Afipia sp.]
MLGLVESSDQSAVMLALNMNCVLPDRIWHQVAGLRDLGSRSDAYPLAGPHLLVFQPLKRLGLIRLRRQQRIVRQLLIRGRIEIRILQIHAVVVKTGIRVCQHRSIRQRKNGVRA